MCKLAGLKAHADHQIPNRVAFAWENSICWPRSPTTSPFHSIFVAMIFIYQNNNIELKLVQIWMSKWCDMADKQWTVGSTPRKIRHWSPSWLQSSPGAISSYLWFLSLIVTSWGTSTQFTFQKHPCLGPQMTSSGKLPNMRSYTVHIYGSGQT
jgi:hypothetical protein